MIEQLTVAAQVEPGTPDVCLPPTSTAAPAGRFAAAIRPIHQIISGNLWIGRSRKQAEESTFWIIRSRIAHRVHRPGPVAA